MKFRERLSVYEKLTRLDKPIGILLLLWPTLWGLWIAADGSPHAITLWIFVLGTVLMRSAGCVMNDYADRDFDRHVERTKNRPITAGLIGTKEALLVAAVLSLLAFFLVLRFNRLTILLSLVAFFLAATYPFMKRFISVPQAYLGIAFGFGIPMAFAAQTNYVPLIAWVLLVSNVFWSIAYDTEYAMVDREDDKKIGIKSSALLFGNYDVAAVMASFTVMLFILTAVGVWQRFGYFYFGGLIISAGLITYQYRLIKERRPMDCFKAFKHNNWIGGAIFLGIVLDFL